MEVVLIVLEPPVDKISSISPVKQKRREDISFQKLNNRRERFEL